MSDGKEVKRFYFVPTGEKDVFGSPTFVCHDKSLNGDDWFMPVEDHDRIVAELRAEVERLKGKTPTRIRFDGTRFKKVKDRFERAFSQLNRPNDTDEQFLISSVESLLLDVGELEARVLHDITYRDETIATQARVIEKYQQAVTRIWVSSDNCEHDMEPNTTMDFFRCEKCGIPSAFAAIEKEGAKDDAI